MGALGPRGRGLGLGAGELGLSAMAPVAFGIFDHVDRGDEPLATLFEQRLRLAQAADAAGLLLAGALVGWERSARAGAVSTSVPASPA